MYGNIRSNNSFQYVVEIYRPAILISMYILVKLISGHAASLSYKIPAHWDKPTIGSLVRVPLRAKFVTGIITEISQEKPAGNFVIKEAAALEPFPADPLYTSFIQELGTYHHVDPVQFIKRIKGFLKEQKRESTYQQEQVVTQQKSVTLTNEQQTVVDYVKPFLTQPTYTPTLVHGVTGSGKTEVYKALITANHALGKTTFLLLPEVSLATQFEQLLQAQLPAAIPIFSFHSSSSAPAKKELWKNLLTQKPCLIIGVHLPVLLPCAQLGLIMIDEEHESGYQEKKHPKINSKEAALMRAYRYQIPIVLGSATPSISSLYNVETKGWKLFSLHQRFAGNFPTVTTASLTTGHQRKSFWITRELEKAIADRLRKKEQIIIFINRRGICFFVQCKQCSLVPHCTSCSVSLTLHADETLRCHYCSYQQPMLISCTKCQAKEFVKKGIGTQAAVLLLKKLFPTASIARADMDTTVNKKLWQRTMQDMHGHKIDILVGTQTITKGYHFPKVTLVGVLWADSNMNFPFYNAHEKTLQQLIQVAGRAGRASQESTVIIQTMAEHQLFNHLNEQQYLAFYQEELKNRQELSYPPVIRFAEIELKHTCEQTVQQDAETIAAKLMQHEHLLVLGPTQPPVAQIKTVWSRKIYLKAPQFGILHQAFSSLNQAKIKSKIFFTPNPLS